MKESAQAALSLVKSRGRAARHRSTALFEKSDIHVHVPAGAIPKDGPSAGVAMFMALASLLTDQTGAQRHRDDRRDQPARPGAAGRRHQGEGARGAQRAGIKRVLLPARNRKDLDDIPESARQPLEFVWLETVDDAIRAALGDEGCADKQARVSEPASV